MTHVQFSGTSLRNGSVSGTNRLRGGVSDTGVGWGRDLHRLSLPRGTRLLGRWPWKWVLQGGRTYGCPGDAPQATAGTEIEDAATVSSFLGCQHLLHGTHVILPAKEELQHPVLQLGALGVCDGCGAAWEGDGLTRNSSWSAGSM